MSEELKPCPFCGSAATPHKHVTDRVSCQNNSCWIYKTYIAIPDWNTRAADAQVKALVEALRYYADGRHFHLNGRFKDIRYECTELGAKAQQALAALSDELKQKEGV